LLTAKAISSAGTGNSKRSSARSSLYLKRRDMSTIEYSKEELDEFRDLVEAGESCNQLERIRCRLDMPKFIERAGREKCDAMFKVLEAEIE